MASDRRTWAWGMRGLLLAGGLCSSVGASACARTVPPYHVTEVRVAAPELPPLCGRDTRCASSRTWVVFYSSYCSSCQGLLRDLAEHSQALAQRGVCVATHLVDAGGCPEAKRVASRTGGWPVAAVGEPTIAAWQVDTTPLVYVLEEGFVRARVQGRAPVAALLEIR